MLFPFARSFDDGTISQSKWENEEINHYINQIRKAKTTTLGVNYLNDIFFGGAFVVSYNGQFLSSLELGKEDILIYDV